MSIPFDPQHGLVIVWAKEGVRVGVMPTAFTCLSMGTGEPDDAKVSRPVLKTSRVGDHPA